MAFQVAGKTALITGAGSGICLSFAKLLLQKRCNVVLVDLALRPEAEHLLETYTSGTRAIFQRTDVSSWSQLRRAFDVAEEQFGGTDIVCPGAGVYEPTFSNFWHPPGSHLSKDNPHNDRYASIDINLIHPIFCTQLAIDHFTKRAKSGSVVHVSSIAAQRPVLTAPLYVAAKSGISNFVRSLAELETSPKGLSSIRVTAVAPGLIKTPLWTDNPDKMKMIDSAKDVWVEPEEVAAVMLDLIENDKHIGGTILEIGKDQVRPVELLNDGGPSGAGHTVSALVKGADEVWDELTSRRDTSGEKSR
ncbi:NAD-dependent 15-hydroxyprostaglandin dehydrogenase [Cadophora sp. MPI-SDFR-AT-0126]|nr:NAD-dependent 15-hydroxyprostaglandin dehydrogenase [Leotiomycetes sp. MPI-SDFR-AT-0126]